MPRLEPELVFLMMRRNTRQSMVERMLYFLVRRRKVRLICEVLLRLVPRARVLGRVLLMVWLHESLVNSVCDDFIHPNTDCCRILVENGATIAEEDAVSVHVRGIVGGRDLEPQDFLQCKASCYFQQWSHERVHMFRQWYITTSILRSQDHTGRMLDGFMDDWFPVQLDNVNKAYIGVDERCLAYDRERDEWIYVEFDVITDGVGVDDGQQFYKVANGSTPPLGYWLRCPGADFERGSVLEVRKVDTRSCLHVFTSDKHSLLQAAQLVADAWAWRGWRFVGFSQSEHLEEVLRECPESWEHAVGIFACAFDRRIFQTTNVVSRFIQESWLV